MTFFVNIRKRKVCVKMDRRLCLICFYSMIKRPLLSFPKLFTRGSKYKALKSLHTQKTKVDRTHCRLFVLIHLTSVSVWKSNTLHHEKCADYISNCIL